MEPHPQMQNITFLDVTGLSSEEIETLEDLLDPDNSKCHEAVELPWDLDCGRPILQPSFSSESEGMSPPGVEPCLAEPLLYTHMAAPPPYSPPEMQFYPPYLFGVPQFVSVKNPYWSGGGGGKGRHRGGNKNTKMAAASWDEEPPVMSPYEMPSFVPPFSYPQHLVYMPVSYPLVPMMAADEAVDPYWSAAHTVAATPEVKKAPATAATAPDSATTAAE